MPGPISGFSLPKISLPSFGELKAKFTAFKGRVSSSLRSIRSGGTPPPNSLQSRDVKQGQPPANGAIRQFKSMAEAKQAVLNANPNVDQKLHHNSFTTKALPKDATNSPEYKQLKSQFADLLKGKTPVTEFTDTINGISGKLGQVLRHPKVADSTKTMLSLDDGKAFMESIKQEMLAEADPSEHAAIERGWKRFERDGLMSHLYNTATIGLTGTVSGSVADHPGVPASITIGDKTYTHQAKLGGGAFGEAHHYRLGENGPSLAVKVPKDPQNRPAVLLEGPASEGRAMINAKGTGVSTSNTANVHTGLRTPDGKMLLVMDLAEYGSMEGVSKKLDDAVTNDLVDSATAAKLKLTPLVGLAKALSGIGIAKGQQHFDIARRNVLVDAKGNGVLSDFGMTEEGSGSRTGSKVPALTENKTMPIRWTPPERLNGQEATTATNSYMFGMTLWESITGRVPLPSLTNRQILDQAADGTLNPVDDLDGIDFSEFPDDFAADLKDLLTKTLQPDPANRLPMDQVLEHPAMQALSDPALQQKLVGVLQDQATLDAQANPPPGGQTVTTSSINYMSNGSGDSSGSAVVDDTGNYFVPELSSPTTSASDVTSVNNDVPENPERPYGQRIPVYGNQPPSLNVPPSPELTAPDPNTGEYGQVRHLDNAQ